MLRWHLQQGRAVIPKSVRPARIAENADVFGFRLTDQELARIDGLATGERGGPDPDAVTRETFGRERPEARTPARGLAVILEDRTRTSAGPQGAVRAPATLRSLLMRRLRAAALLVPALALTLSACGGGSSAYCDTLTDNSAVS